MVPKQVEPAFSEHPGYDRDQLIINHATQAPSEHPAAMDKLPKYLTPAEVNQMHILKSTKNEIKILLSMSIEINRTTPLIYEEMYVVEHLQRIEEYFEELQDNLSEVRDYMVALLEWIAETQDANIKIMIPQLEKIIFLLREVCPPDDEIMVMQEEQDLLVMGDTATGVGATPGGLVGITPMGPGTTAQGPPAAND